MLGPDDVVDMIKESGEVTKEIQDMYGIIPRATYDIFNYVALETKKNYAQFEIKLYYLEIYNESLNNLLTMPTQTGIKMREQKSGNVHLLNVDPKYV